MKFVTKPTYHYIVMVIGLIMLGISYIFTKNTNDMILFGFAIIFSFISVIYLEKEDKK